MIIKGYIALPKEKHAGWKADIEIPQDGTLQAINAKYLVESPNKTKVLHINFSTVDIAFMLEQSSLTGNPTLEEIMTDLGLSDVFIGTTRSEVLSAVPSLNGNKTIEFTDPDTGDPATYETPKLPYHDWA